MDQKAYETIMEGLEPVFEAQKLLASPDAPGVYLNDKKAVKVDYDEQRKLFRLSAADIEEGKEVQFRELSAWLFDETHNLRDAKAVSEDFGDSLRELFGMKKQQAGSLKEVALPSKAASGATPNVEALAQRFLAIFPQYKDAYREHMAKYGEFLYQSFFSQTAAVKLKELAADPKANKKQLGKFFTMLNEMYAEGDANVSSTVTYTILGNAFGGDLERFDALKDFMEDCPYLRQNGRAMLQCIKGNRKLKEGLSL